jgi:hypothetical protein
MRWVWLISHWSLFPLRLGGDRHSTSKDHVDLSHLLITIKICLALIDPPGLLRCWWWHLLSIYKSLALFQIVPRGAVNLAPLLCVARTPKMPLLLLL